jgi:hypothetical protein
LQSKKKKKEEEKEEGHLTHTTSNSETKLRREL